MKVIKKRAETDNKKKTSSGDDVPVPDVIHGEDVDCDGDDDDDDVDDEEMM